MSFTKPTSEQVDLLSPQQDPPDTEVVPVPAAQEPLSDRAFILDAARDPNIDPEKLKVLWEMVRQNKKDEAEKRKQ